MTDSVKTRKRHGIKSVIVIVFVLCMIMLSYEAAMLLTAGTVLSPPTAAVINNADMSRGIDLILINDENLVPEDYEVELTELSNGQRVATHIYPSLQKMFDDMRAQGYSPEVVSGYRTSEKQQRLLDEKIEAYRNEGCTYRMAESLAELSVAKPGTSEHQLGIAVDINEKGVDKTSDEFYLWLDLNAYKYGFIKRYPADKTDITGIKNEPWHYRYVGEAATEIYRRGICLEEYIESLDK